MQLVGGEGEIIPTTSPSGLEVPFPDLSAPVDATEEEEKEQEAGEDDRLAVTSVEANAVVSPSLLTRCAVFTCVLAVAAAVTLSLIRS